MLTRIIPPVAILAAFALIAGIFRMSQSSVKPTRTPPPSPTVAEIQERAKNYRYEIGKYGGTLRDWITNEMKDLNYAVSTDAQTTNVLSGIVFETLLTRDSLTFEFAPLLAVAVPERSEDPDGRVYIVRLRKGVQWHDGRPFTADDVIFSYNDIALNESIACTFRPAMQQDVLDESGKTVKRNLLVEKIDDHTVRFTMPQRYALYLQLISGMPIFPKHILKPRVDDGTFASTWNIGTPPAQIIGTGPFMPFEYVSGERFVLKRNPNYWDKDEAGNRLPYLDRIVFNIVPNPETLKNRFLNRDVDYLEVRLIDLAEIQKKAAAGGFEVFQQGPRAGWAYLCFNQNPRSRPDGTPYVAPHKSAWFRDIRWRRAIAHAIDKESIIQICSDGFAQPNWVPYTPKYTKYYTGDVRKYPYDLEESRRLLTEMDLVDRDGDGMREDAKGNKAEYVVSVVADDEVIRRLVAILTEDMQKIGVRLIAEYLQFNLLVRRISADWNWEAMNLGYTAGPEPLLGKSIWKSSEVRRVWNPKVPPGSPENRPWEIRIDEIFEKAYTHWDEKEKRFQWEKDVELAHEWQRLCAENLPHIYLNIGNQVYAVYSRVKNRRSTVYALYDIERLYVEE